MKNIPVTEWKNLSRPERREQARTQLDQILAFWLEEGGLLEGELATLLSSRSSQYAAYEDKRWDRDKLIAEVRRTIGMDGAVGL